MEKVLREAYSAIVEQIASGAYNGDNGLGYQTCAACAYALAAKIPSEPKDGYLCHACLKELPLHRPKYCEECGQAIRWENGIVEI